MARKGKTPPKKDPKPFVMKYPEGYLYCPQDNLIVPPGQICTACTWKNEA